MYIPGYRPGRSQHQALDALYAGLLTRKVSWVLDVDIRGFFDAIDHGWLVQFVEHRIADRRVVRLIQKWLNAGVRRQTIRKRLQAKLSEVKAELRRRMHDPIPEVGRWLISVVGGHLRYYGVPMNTPALSLFRFQVDWLWYRVLSRRSQNGRIRWDRMRRLTDRWLPPARVCHPYPLRRLGVIT